ncbi:MAG: outer membrane beta-barrel family protein [Prevotella sp.]|jgi:hypothetical protein|nr:outer membrane beta-barrel family protein [Prevotella sp.]MCI2088300.1 outer membrane beta-barrel family protein [Prevotella sp.]MCI2125226.1 outer membrane beta-barrel family protein [Prevotella sp.]
MKEKITLISLFCVIALHLSAQTTIKGIIVDEHRQPLPFAQLTLKSSKDSSFIKSGSCDSIGRFALTCKKLPVILSVNYIGYQIKEIVYSSSEFKRIALIPDTISLHDVIITGRRPRMKLTAEGVLTSISGTVLSKVGTAEDVLSHIPMIRKTKDGFEVFGKGTPLIYINNKEMRDESELQQLKSSDILSIELITNPGSKYDATVKSVIKIKTRKAVGDGWSIDTWGRYGKGRKDKGDETLSADLNYRKSGLDLFGSVWTDHNKSLQYATMSQDAKSGERIHEEEVMDNRMRNLNIELAGGADYDINNQSIGIKYTMYVPTTNKIFTTFNSQVFQNSQLFDNLRNNTSSKTKGDVGSTINTYYVGTVGKTEINFNADELNDGYKEKNAIDENSQAQDNRHLDTENRVRNNLVAAKLSLTFPLWKGNFTWGSEDSYTYRKDDYSNPQGYVASSKSTLRNYNLATFINYSHELPFGTAEAGVRYEHLDFHHDGDKKQRKIYNNVFPTFSFNTQISNVQLQAAYSLKTARPTYRQLSNDVFYANMYSLQKGNPMLENSTIHDASLTMIWKFLQFNLDYTDRRKDIIYFMYPESENSDVVITSYKNLHSVKTITPFLDVAPAIGKWNPDLSIGVSKQWLTAASFFGEQKFNKPIWMIGFNNTLEFGKNFIGELNFNYQGKGNSENVYLSKSTVALDLELTKTLCHDHLILKIAGEDLFNRNNDSNILYCPAAKLSQDNRYYKRQVVFTIRYRWNTTGKRYKGTGAGNDEKSRL